MNLQYLSLERFILEEVALQKSTAASKIYGIINKAFDVLMGYTDDMLPPESPGGNDIIFKKLLTFIDFFFCF